MRIDERGHVHIIGIAIAVLAFLAFAPYVIRYLRSQSPSSEGYNPMSNQSSGNYYPDDGQSAKALEGMITTAIDQQAKLAQLKAQAAMIVWNSLDKDTKQAIVNSLADDFKKKEDQISQFIEGYDMSQWDNMSPSEKKVKINGFIDNINQQQRALADILNKLANNKER